MVSKSYYGMVEPLPIMYRRKVYQHTLPNLTNLGEVENLEGLGFRHFSYVKHCHDNDII